MSDFLELQNLTLAREDAVAIDTINRPAAGDMREGPAAVRARRRPLVKGK